MLNNEISKDNKISGDLLYPHETDNIENTNIKYKRRLERLYNNITNKTSNLYIIITRFNIMDELILIIKKLIVIAFFQLFYII